jgi:SAM-dependent methyltransferase
MLRPYYFESNYKDKVNKMDHKKITESNREAWNEATLKHQQGRKIDYKKEFLNPNYSTLDEIITSKLNEIGVAGKIVAQTNCNNGRELLSVLNMGAKSGVGFDISDNVIEEARGLAKISGKMAEFVRTNIYDIDEKYFNSFDLVIITIGALCWMPDLSKYFEIISGLLKSGGYLLIYEQHPITNILGCEREPDYEPEDPMRVVYSYFRTEPWIDNNGIDYIGNTIYESATTYGFTQKISDIFNAIIKNGLKITEFYEYPHDISMSFSAAEKFGKIPLSYILTGIKE